jgi:hypothetical protein
MNQKTTLAIAVAIVGGVAISVASPWNPKADPNSPISLQKSKSSSRNADSDMETRASSLNMNAAGIKNIKVDIELGTLEISTNSSNSFNAQITKGINRPLGEVERQWLDNPWLKVRREGDTLVVYEDKGLKPDLKSLNKNRNGNNQLDLVIKIQIPKGLNADLSLTAGSEMLSGEFRSLTTRVMAGELNLDQVDSGEFLNVKVEAGEVNAKLTRVPSRDSSIKVSVGEINLDVRGNATVIASSSFGAISASGRSDEDQDGLGSKQQICLGTGGTKVTLDVGAGSINVGNGTIEKRLRKDKKGNSDLGTNFEIDVSDDQDVQAEVSKALREVENAMKSVDIKDQVERAMKEVQFELNSKDIENEIAKATRESKVDIESALKSADREMKHAMRELEIEMREAEDSEGRYRTLSRDALRIAKQVLDQTRITLKKSMSHMKGVPHKSTKKKISHD